MILDIRVKEEGNKIIFQKYVCDSPEIIDGYMQFSLKNAKWKTFWECERTEIETAYSIQKCLCLREKEVRLG